MWNISGRLFPVSFAPAHRPHTSVHRPPLVHSSCNPRWGFRYRHLHFPSLPFSQSLRPVHWLPAVPGARNRRGFVHVDHGTSVGRAAGETEWRWRENERVWERTAAGQVKEFDGLLYDDSAASEHSLAGRKLAVRWTGDYGGGRKRINGR